MVIITKSYFYCLVPCPPGSYYNKDGAVCAPCAVTMYQGESGITDCKKCQSPKTSTITGAEGCYFDHSMSILYEIFITLRVTMWLGFT